jgi:xanthine dehydrogenase accessory factor
MSKEGDKSIYEAILEAKRSGQTIILATVIRERGSVPRHAGAKMLVYPDGRILGTIGGGEVESRVIAEALELLPDGSPRVVEYKLVDPATGDPGVCGGEMEFFLEPILPEPTVLVIGCGHVGQAVADLAHWLGFRVVVTDDRPELCTPEIIPHADEYLPVPGAEIAKAFAIHSQTYIAAVTRGVPEDTQALPALVDSPAAYIGVIGSRRRWATTVEELRAMGVDEAKLKRVHAPIGLEIEAETPREIAVSILAEIIAVRNGGTGEPMKWEGASDEER